MQINEQGFYVDTYDGEFEVLLDVRGTVKRRISAADLDHAKRQARNIMENEDDFLELDDLDEVRIVGVAPLSPMYLVTRDGRKMRVSHLQPGDQPREPDERGF